MRSRGSVKRAVASPGAAPAPARASSVAEALSSIMGGEAPKPLPGGRREKELSELEKEVREAKLRAQTGDWEKVRGGTLVGLYALCHLSVYQLLPEELKDKGTFTAAARRAMWFMRRNFEGSPAKMVHFIKWAWEREKKRAEWAKSKNFDRNRFTWQKQFAAYLLTDYQLELQKERA